MDRRREAGDNAEVAREGATADEAGRPLLVPGVTVTASGAVLMDPGVMGLTPDDAHWTARRTSDQVARETREYVEALRLLGAGKWAGPQPAIQPLAALMGVTRTPEADNPFRPSGDTLRARQQLRENTVRLALERRPVEGYCKRGLHLMTEDNMSGEHCRACRNAFYRAKRAGITVEEALRRAA